MKATSDLKLALSAALSLRSLLIMLGCALVSLLLLWGIGYGLWLFVLADYLMDSRWGSYLATYGGWILYVVIGWFLLPTLMLAFGGLFIDHVIEVEEKKHYPHLPPALPISLWVEIKLAFSSIRRALGYNLLVLPLLFFPPAAIMAYLLVNASILKRDTFFMIVLRRMSYAEAKLLYRKLHKSLFKTGLVMAGLFMVPGINLLAPIMSATLMLHHLWRENESDLVRIPCPAPQ